MSAKLKAVLIAVLIAASLGSYMPADQTVPPPPVSPIENDWLFQAELIGGKVGISTEVDAQGGCDGVKNGKWGFHTQPEANPWWQVDLGDARKLGRIEVFNRCDIAPRAAKLTVLLSDDAKAWRLLYRHDGSVFYGFTDNSPLVVAADGQSARYVRLQLDATDFFHLDEVEVYGPDDPAKNLALMQPADQSSISQWSAPSPAIKQKDYETRIEKGIRLLIPKLAESGAKLIADYRASGFEPGDLAPDFEKKASAASTVLNADNREGLKTAYLELRRSLRKLALANPLLDFDDLLFVKRAPGSFTHMSDQYIGWWSRPGGGVCIMRDFKSDAPEIICLTESLPPGNFVRPDLSYDGRKMLFAYCRYYPEVMKVRNKLEKEKLPEDSFYHVYEMNIDGTGLRRLTSGRYNDFDAHYLPNGDIVFLSTRRGHFFQCGSESAQTTQRRTLEEGYVRCGGDDYRPCAVYTLHRMNADGGDMRAISAFEMFEWYPSVASDGRILYSRWDYVDRHNMPFMKLWSANPDGSDPRLVYGNFTHSPHCTFEPRSIPGSDKIVFTASGHHSITAGSIVLLDPKRGNEGADPITRLTPEVCFPEIEGWPSTYYVSPWPLSETYYLTAWSGIPIQGQGTPNPVNALGLYVYDAFGNREFIYRDPEISSVYPTPLRPRRKPPVVADLADSGSSKEGRFLLQDVYAGMPGIERGTVKSIRIVGVPIKTQPFMNTPRIGITRDDPGKCVLGTAPVEADGSAFFRVPSGVNVFFQALDADGVAIQTMRSITYVQPGQTLSCIGCHEHRQTAPQSAPALASRREPSKLKTGPDGSWPLRFDKLVQPVLDKHCAECHRNGSKEPKAAKLALTPDKSYDNLISIGSPSLSGLVLQGYNQSRSIPGQGTAARAGLLKHLKSSHKDVQLTAEEYERLITWMDTCAQLLGSFSEAQEQDLIRLRREWVDMFEERTQSSVSAQSPDSNNAVAASAKK
ncbi:MAG TPA: discoidin domain-containing protein [Candidatus Brocadiia bacterium]|nr:discoidin domain-containing protein [Candidatus Brocadiia bacterium]